MQDILAQLARAHEEVVAAIQRTPASPAVAPMEQEQEDGYATPEDEAAPEAAPGLPDPAKLTVNEIKAWLMEHGQEQRVWELTTTRAKKAQWVECMRAHPDFQTAA